MRANNFEQKADFFGRKPASFYKNIVRQEPTYMPDFVSNLRDHGFKFWAIYYLLFKQLEIKFKVVLKSKITEPSLFKLGMTSCKMVVKVR